MAIPGPGQAISINTIVTEFGGTAPHAISEYYRGGPEVGNAPVNAAIPTSGQIALSNFYGASNRIAIPLTYNGFTGTVDVYNSRGPTYVPSISDITVTIGPDGNIYNNSGPGGYALLVPNAFSPTDTVTIVNNGVINGFGGGGGNGGDAATRPASAFNPSATASPGSPGSSGGNAVYVNRPVTIQNNGRISGGGGGGGGGAGRASAAPPTSPTNPQRRAMGGGGGGGGAGDPGGGSGGTGGTTSGTGPSTNRFLVNGTGGSTAVGGVGGSGGPGGTTATAPSVTGGAGGTGGSTGSAGLPGGTGSTTAPLNKVGTAGTGGAAGNYITGNPFVTWTATGTRLGGVA